MDQTALLVIDVQNIDGQNIYAEAGSPLFVRGFAESLTRINDLAGGFARVFGAEAYHEAMC
jgi:hypothetical protein